MAERNRAQHHVAEMVQARSGQMEGVQKEIFGRARRSPEQVEKLVREGRKRNVTLLFSAKETEHNNAVALKEYVEQLM